MSTAASLVEDASPPPADYGEFSHAYGYVGNGSVYMPRLTLGVGQIHHTDIIFDNVLEGVAWGDAIQFPSANQSIPEIDISELLEGHLDRLYSAARDELFEGGRKSQFSKGLQQLCTYAPVAVMQSLKARLVAESRISAEVVAETLRWAADQEAIFIRDSAIDFLSMGLYHPSSLVRDAAALSLAYLDEDAAANPLRRAIEREKVPELRDDLEALVRSLED